MASNSLDVVSKHTLFDKLRFSLVLFIIIFAVIFRAGNRPIPLVVLELASISLLILLFLTPDRDYRISGFLNKSIWALLCLPLLYLIPVPWSLWAELPGRELYSQTLSLADSDSMRPVSIYPLKTEMALLALLPPVAVFFSTLRFSVKQVKTLVMVLLGIAFFEAVLSLVQYGDGITSNLRFGNPYASSGGEGTFANRNHLAGLLEMLLPIGLGLLCLSIGHTRSELRYHSNWRSRMTAFSGFHMNKSIVYGFVCIIILLGIIFTQSRSGVALAMLGILISTFAYSKRLGGTNVFGVIGTFVAVVIAIAAEIGLIPLLQRFTVDHLSNLRFTIYENTIQGIGAYFPIGSGPGTYPFVYPRFQSIEESGFINHAHNDYLEWLMEGGMAAALLIVIFLWLYFSRWLHVWIKGYWSTFRFIQVGAGIGVLLMILHGFTDFNLHIPANAIYFAFLSAVFFYPCKEKEESVEGELKNSYSGTDMAEQKSPVHTITNETEVEDGANNNKISPEDIPNPFTEADNDKDA